MEDVLEDPVMSWVNAFLPLNYSSSLLFLPCWTGKASGWSTFCKGATSVVVCTALLLAARHYYYHRRRHMEGQPLPTSPATPRLSSTPRHSERRRRPMVTSSPSRNAAPSRQKSIASEVATVSFVESDSEEEGCINERKPLEVNIIPVVDEVGTEADDELSETEAELLPRIKDTVVQEKAKSPLSTAIHIKTEPSLLLPLDQSGNKVSEFNLTFESDSNNSDPESILTSYHKNSRMNGRIVMDIGRNQRVPQGYMEEKSGTMSGRREGGGEGEDKIGRRVSLDEIRTSVVGSDDEDVVVTQAVVTIG